jgi:hypothetical protein
VILIRKLGEMSIGLFQLADQLRLVGEFLSQFMRRVGHLFAPLSVLFDRTLDAGLKPHFDWDQIKGPQATFLLRFKQRCIRSNRKPPRCVVQGAAFSNSN